MKRKNPYLLIDVNQISIQALTRDRWGHAAVVGVDVAEAVKEDSEGFGGVHSKYDGRDPAIRYWARQLDTATGHGNFRLESLETGTRFVRQGASLRDSR